MCMDTCITCAFKRRKRAIVSGSHPMLTKNFSTRGQMDLVHYSATPDTPHEYLLCHRNHGIKIENYRLLRNKYFMAVVRALLPMFRVNSPLDVLQSDNVGEFANIAYSSKTACFTLEEI